MISYTQGNLLESGAEALVNTVNTVGVMGKGIALMFKERFARNYQLYSEACKSQEVEVGRMFVTEPAELGGPRWIVNFPTKQHWRSPSKLEWIDAGLDDLRDFLVTRQVKSIAVPPLGAGNGGLDWPTVRARIEAALGDLKDVQVTVYEPTSQYQNVAKRAGVETLTPARALVAEMVRRYSVLGMDCSLLEVQKLAWFLERHLKHLQLDNPLKFNFKAHRYGPYAMNLNKLLDSLDGSYLHSDKRIADADPANVIWFDDGRKAVVLAFLKSEVKHLLPALEATDQLIDGFQSPFGMELLASVDWLLSQEKTRPEVNVLLDALSDWPAENAAGAGARKRKLFDAEAVAYALDRLQRSSLYTT
ncbi:type II toxin-antitoxin system antitoxin DNA ADP-ribosyl glycohydrolase DarG [Roseateles amylovorans]|uniref:Macro domain-containing protein n=1 Tax=Roseateles amylovorans TaxID=2978473 RepID=A0ABY6B3D0_9BURK|nr:macro domain-containing protein [Roseateles amylovorans]UXH78033.1 macro domain-containing protein [Roseateles amylovorans]